MPFKLVDKMDEMIFVTYEGLEVEYVSESSNSDCYRESGTRVISVPE